MKNLLLTLLLYPCISYAHFDSLYSVQFSTVVKTSLAVFGGSGKDTSITGSLNGRMRMYCIEQGNQQQIFYVRFDSTLKVDFPLPAKDLSVMHDNLLQGFQFNLIKNGLIDSIF